jgi:hypothetical protein
MSDTVEKLLFAVVGFILGTAATLIVDVVRDRRRRGALLELMRAEARAFAGACRSAEQHRFWTSTNARRLAELIRERYSNAPERWMACRSPEVQRAISDFYLDCAGLLDLINLYEEQERQGTPVESRAIGSGTYEGIANRTEQLLALLGEPGDSTRSRM